MGFKFVVSKSPENSTENHSAKITNGYIDRPSRLRQTFVGVRRARYGFHLYSKFGQNIDSGMTK